MTNFSSRVKTTKPAAGVLMERRPFDRKDNLANEANVILRNPGAAKIHIQVDQTRLARIALYSAITSFE